MVMIVTTEITTTTTRMLNTIGIALVNVLFRHHYDYVSDVTTN